MGFHSLCYAILTISTCLLLTMEAKHHKNQKGPVKVAGFVVYRKQGAAREYLLLEQSKESHKWTPPKGRVESNETEIQGASRELTEETGLTADDINVIINFKKVITTTKGKHQKEITFWIGYLHTPDKPITLSPEHLQYKWLPLKEALDISDEVTKQALEDSDKYLTKTER